MPLPVEALHLPSLDGIDKHEQSKMEQCYPGIFKRQRTMDTFTIQPWSDAKKIAKFHDLLLEATVTINLPFQWIEQRAVRRLLEFLNPMAPKYFPARKTLITNVLDRCAIRQDLNNKNELK
ncbi:hypothetical protein PsorP6_017515 [Peronosclerospora sorghi]|uniref:Uncharacterized protein n=1 Tax=Peronosclerospora sorghi TaxID=230839 RepID=A0ACC0WNT6_9STRA|nr:hypothetical protein PsorP6_017515 [Peronosclerospora sorghi]